MGLDTSLRRELEALAAGKVLFDEPSAPHASLRAGGAIDALAFPETVSEVSRIAGFLHDRDVPCLPVGNWTNLLVRDGGFRGVLISLSRLRTVTLKNRGTEDAFIFAEAGCPVAELVKTAETNALAGAEFCAGIPGSIGGAVRMNAGAYGGQMKDVTEEITIVAPSGRIETMPGKHLKFTYRNLDFPANSIIVAALFHLHSGDPEKIAARVREIVRMRKEKHPLDLPNAGSIFKNPPDIPAGRLIEEAGLKGQTKGDAQVSEKHANFIVNRGTATAEEILSLMEMTQNVVFQKTGWMLEPELRVVGEE
jgi:UDP-N-acetylmuramate dehydrogenase